MTPEQQKSALKEALKEWLDEKYTTLGKWTLGTVASLGIFALCYFILSLNGWHK